MIIFEKVQSMHQAQSPQQRCMKENHWKQVYEASYGKTLLFWKTHSIKATKNMHLKACQQLRGGKAFLTRALHKKRLNVNHPTVFYQIGEGGRVLLSYLYFIPRLADKYDTVLLRNTKQRVETNTHKTAQFPADGGCCFGFASKFLTELSASKMWEPARAQKIDTHTLIYLTSHLIPNWQICFQYLTEYCNTYFCFQHKQESTKKRTGRPRCQSDSMQAS